LSDLSDCSDGGRIFVLEVRLVAQERSESTLATVRHIQKSVLILVILVDLRHQRCCWREGIVDEDEDGLFGFQLDSLSDHIHKLANRQIGWNEVFFLVNVRDIAVGCLFRNDRDTIRVFCPNPLGF